jgi:hypothetical protein
MLLKVLLVEEEEKETWLYDNEEVRVCVKVEGISEVLKSVHCKRRNVVDIGTFYHRATFFFSRKKCQGPPFNVVVAEGFFQEKNVLTTCSPK